MAYLHQLNPIFDSLSILKTSNLRKWNYLTPYSKGEGTLSWTRSISGEKVASVGLRSFIGEHFGYLQFNFNYNGEPKEIKVEVFTRPSNLGKGKIWYFVCPITGKTCRQLYLYRGRFLHREAIEGGLYECQTYSAYVRILDKRYKEIFGGDKAYEEIYSKYFKKYYKGKPTKRYLKLYEQARISEQYTVNDINLLYHGIIV